MLYKGERGSFLRVELIVTLLFFWKSLLLLSLGFEHCKSFNFLERKGPSLLWPLNLWEGELLFVNLGQGKEYKIAIEPVYGFACGFNTLWVISRYFSCNFIILSKFHNSSTSSIEVENLILNENHTVIFPEITFF